MPIIDEKTRRIAANSIFPSLFLGAFGLVLTQAWAAQMSGSWQLHAILGIPGIALLGLTFYRARLHWAAGIAEMPERTGGRRLPVSTRDFVWYFLLFGTGIVIALSAASAFLLGIVASLMYLVPWAKIPVCRTRFIASSIIMLAGAVAWLALYGKPAHPLHYVVAAWMVLIPPMMMQFFVLVSLPEGYRMREPAQVKNPNLHPG
jgi:hypothetical protein